MLGQPSSMLASHVVAMGSTLHPFFGRPSTEQSLFFQHCSFAAHFRSCSASVLSPPGVVAQLSASLELFCTTPLHRFAPPAHPNMLLLRVSKTTQAPKSLGRSTWARSKFNPLLPLPTKPNPLKPLTNQPRFPLSFQNQVKTQWATAFPSQTRARNMLMLNVADRASSRATSRSPSDRSTSRGHPVQHL